MKVFNKIKNFALKRLRHLEENFDTILMLQKLSLIILVIFSLL